MQEGKGGEGLGGLLTCGSYSPLGINDEAVCPATTYLLQESGSQTTLSPPLYSSTSATSHDTLFPLSSLLSFLGLLGDTLVPFPGLFFTVQPHVYQEVGFTSHLFHMYSASPCELDLKREGVKESWTPCLDMEH